MLTVIIRKQCIPNEWLMSTVPTTRGTNYTQARWNTRVRMSSNNWPHFYYYWVPMNTLRKRKKNSSSYPPLTIESSGSRTHIELYLHLNWIQNTDLCHMYMNLSHSRYTRCMNYKHSFTSQGIDPPNYRAMTGQSKGIIRILIERHITSKKNCDQEVNLQYLRVQWDIRGGISSIGHSQIPSPAAAIFITQGSWPEALKSQSLHLRLKCSLKSTKQFCLKEK